MPKVDKKNNIPKAITPALFFGLKYLNNPLEVTSEDIKNAKSAIKEKGYLNESLFPIEEIVSLFRYYKSKDESLSNPMFFITTGIAQGTHNKHKIKPKETYINIHFLGVNESIIEAMAIKISDLILKNSGQKNNILKLNNIGDKSAQTAFLREATNYYRKNITDLNADLRQLFKKSLFELYTKGKNQCVAVHENAPEPMDFLGEETREHFSELLEFVEYLDIQYEVDCHLLGDPNYSSHTIFEIKDSKTEKVLASGTRYNLLSKKVGFRKEIPGISVLIKIKEAKTISEKTLEQNFTNAKFYMIHVGKAAKIKSLKLLSDLSEKGIFVKHSIFRDKISTQLLLAKKSNAPYHIIIGHKEALENTAIVKDSNGRWQKTLKIDDLLDYLKSLK